MSNCDVSAAFAPLQNVLNQGFQTLKAKYLMHIWTWKSCLNNSYIYMNDWSLRENCDGYFCENVWRYVFYAQSVINGWFGIKCEWMAESLTLFAGFCLIRWCFLVTRSGHQSLCSFLIVSLLFYYVKVTNASFNMVFQTYHSRYKHVSLHKGQGNVRFNLILKETL